MHKTCESDCDNHVCRAFFPIKQPLIDPKSKDICYADDHQTECLQYEAAIEWREEKRIRGMTEKCRFATNTRCGRPWEWWCKGSDYPFLLTTYETKEGKDDIPERNADGSIKFNYDKEMVENACLSGDPSIYEQCPNFKRGVELLDMVTRLKKQEKQ